MIERHPTGMDCTHSNMISTLRCDILHKEYAWISVNRETERKKEEYKKFLKEN